MSQSSSILAATIRGFVSKETVVRQWGVETNVWFINSVDNLKGKYHENLMSFQNLKMFV